MPKEELETEKEIVTTDMIKEMYERAIHENDHVYTALALTENREPVGFSELSVNTYHQPVAWQGDTGVKKEHRGHRLGLALKYQLYKLLLEKTNAQYWVTENASMNEHMLAINQALGYQLWSETHEFQFKRDAILETLRQVLSS